MNPIKTLKQIRSQLKRKYYAKRKGFRRGRALVPFVSPQEGNDMIREVLLSNKPLMIARHGSNEMGYVSQPDKRTFKALCGIAGFFPQDPEMGKAFIRRYHAACADIDLLGIWNFRHGRFRNEERLFDRSAEGARLVDLTSLSPFLHASPWSSALAGKRVLVVHPFAATIPEQYHRNRERLFENPKVLPLFKSLVVVPAVQSMGGSDEYANWFEALDSMCRAVEQHDFDVALIGCGAYGLPLASHIKKMGKQAIHIGGTLQLLFGIKGGRWEGNGYDYHLKYYNDTWVRPKDDETPKNAKQYEEGAYW